MYHLNGDGWRREGRVDLNTVFERYYERIKVLFQVLLCAVVLVSFRYSSKLISTTV
jgi:hypothetical protein